LVAFFSLWNTKTFEEGGIELSKALIIGFIFFNLSSHDKDCCRFEHFRLALIVARIKCENECRSFYRVIEAADWLSAM